MKLYHGGLIPIEHPRIIQNEIGRDFGFAFYTTDIQEQAERWALRRKLTAVGSTPHEHSGRGMPNRAADSTERQPVPDR